MGKETAEKAAEKRKKGRYTKFSSILWALKKLWKLYPRLFITFLTIPLMVAQTLAASYFTKTLLDALGGGASFGKLTAIVAGFSGGLVLLELLRKAGRTEHECLYYPTNAYQSWIDEFRNAKTDYENLEKQDIKRIAQYISDDIYHGDPSVEFVWEDLFEFLYALCGIGACGSLIGFLNPALFAVVAVTSLMSWFTTRWQPSYYDKHKQNFEKERRKVRYFRGLSEDFSFAKEIKLYGMEDWLSRMAGDYQRYVFMWERKCSLRGLFAGILSGTMAFVQNGAAYLVLLSMFAGNGISVGDFVFYFGVVGSMAGFLQSLITQAAKLNTRGERIGYYREFFDYPSKGNYGQGSELPTGKVKIEFKNVCYRYDGADKDTIKDLNLTIEAGESIALVGRNGAGKSTFVKLLCGFYHPTKGEIIIDGKKIDAYNIDEYYSLISAVFQEVRAVAFTVFEFVASADLSRKNAREDAVRALKQADLWEKIEGIPLGLDTHLMKGVYDDGVDFSGGEMQKLLLARAVYKDGSILVLDEPTAALDPIAENNLYLKYRDLTAGKTSVYISHRFASTRFCDRIILLDEGEIKETGTHEELMEQNGMYAQMFGVQAKYYED